MTRDDSPNPTERVAQIDAKRPRGRPRKTDNERDDGNRRQALLAAAAHLFRQKGFAATTTRDIAAAAGMQSGSPFYHFKSKGDLLHAVIEEGMRTTLVRQRALVQTDGYAQKTPAQQLEMLMRVHFEVLLGPGNDFVPVMLYESRSLKARQHKQLAALIADYEALWLPVLDALVAQGRLRGPVKLVRLLILGALNWSVQWFNPKKEASIEELTQVAVSMFLKES
jgi:AcrR family transcriptional regulator